jgi:hypothetical protein
MAKKKITIGTPKTKRAGVGAFGNKICHFAGKKRKKSQLASDQTDSYLGAFRGWFCCRTLLQ